VPCSFLDSLLRNTNVKQYEYWTTTLHACAISQQLSTISMSSSIFILLLEQRLDARLFVLASLVTFFVGFLVLELALSHKQRLLLRSSRSKAVKSSILVLLILVALSPVLRTLSAATSSDSIWPLAGVLFAINALFADYGGSKRGPSSSAARLTSVLSINAALIASVVLASRLPDDSSVFAFTLLSVLMFGQLPMLRRRTPEISNKVTTLTTICLAMSALLLAFRISLLYALLSGVLIIFVTFGAPQVLIWAQGFKNEIRGPWDVASPVVSSVDKAY